MNYFEDLDNSDLMKFYKEFVVASQNGMMKQSEAVQEAMNHFREKDPKLPALSLELELKSEIVSRWIDR